MGSTETCTELGISRSALSQWLDKGWITADGRFTGGAYVFTSAEVNRAKAAAALRLASAEAAS